MMFVNLAEVYQHHGNLGLGKGSGIHGLVT